ncbi:hypothetical protein [Cellulophaga baltica]|uniref:hypothetical protein n=1 Tax=Cellulophaga baltica TaxID=76594 RepID=UPI0024954B0E|nr:hypothetical protein [Cellulophaga baltica]
MGKLTINSVSDSNVSYEGVTTEMDEFIPLVSLRDPQKYNTKNDELLMDMDENGNPIFVDLLSETVDSQVNEAIQAIITKLEKPIIPFTVKKGGPDFTFGKGDDDGYISLELSLEKDKYVEVEGATASIKLKDDSNYSDKVLVKWEDNIDVEIDITTKKSIEFYIRFLANDDKDRFEGDYENLFCGCFKVVALRVNEWQFSIDKIEEIREYAIENLWNRKHRTNANSYHHCTDTHKHIVLSLLDKPPGLHLGANQNHLHSANRVLPTDFEKAGESTTSGVRKTLISSTYAESSKTFTVIDIKNNEVLSIDGKAGNTSLALKSFKKSPVSYLKSNCPQDGFYVFIGAFNADYHSFTIVVERKKEDYLFEYIDQMDGLVSVGEDEIDKILLKGISVYRENFPMKVEFYQLRNEKK